jgi:hypothetical protein
LIKFINKLGACPYLVVDVCTSIFNFKYNVSNLEALAAIKSTSSFSISSKPTEMLINLILAISMMNISNDRI